MSWNQRRIEGEKYLISLNKIKHLSNHILFSRLLRPRNIQTMTNSTENDYRERKIENRIVSTN